MDYLVVYDIADVRRLRRIAGAMEHYGIRVQKSVFECELDTSLLSAMQQEVSRQLDPLHDSVRIYPLQSGSRSKQMIIGIGEITRIPQACVV